MAEVSEFVDEAMAEHFEIFGNPKDKSEYTLHLSSDVWEMLGKPVKYRDIVVKVGGDCLAGYAYLAQKIR